MCSMGRGPFSSRSIGTVCAKALNIRSPVVAQFTCATSHGGRGQDYIDDSKMFMATKVVVLCSRVLIHTEYLRKIANTNSIWFSGHSQRTSLHVHSSTTGRVNCLLSIVPGLCHKLFKPVNRHSENCLPRKPVGHNVCCSLPSRWQTAHAAPWAWAAISPRRGLPSPRTPAGEPREMLPFSAALRRISHRVAGHEKHIVCALKEP